MEQDLIFTTIKAVVIFWTIFGSEPFTKVSNWFLLRAGLPPVLNHLLECGWCLNFWIWLIISIVMTTTTPLAVAILTYLLLDKLNEINTYK